MSYLGMVNFYRRFIKGAARALKPLTDALRGASGKAAKLEWSTPMLEAFEGSKKQMVQATHLAHPGKKARLALSVGQRLWHPRRGSPAAGGVLRQPAAPGILLQEAEHR